MDGRSAALFSAIRNIGDFVNVWSSGSRAILARVKFHENVDREPDRLAT
jgi:hypothetical protein